MSENLMVGTHKYASPKYLDNYDRIFNKQEPTFHRCYTCGELVEDGKECKKDFCIERRR